MQPGYGHQPAGERWNVNMPAVIGVVFVLLVGVVIWVIASSSGGDGDEDAEPVQTTTTVAAASPAPTSTDVTTDDTTPMSTTPAPMPATTAPAETTTPSSAPATTEPPPPATAAPATTAPGSDVGTVPGDLGVADRPMQQPTCDGGYIAVLASPIGEQATAASLASVLDTYPGSNYLRTDQTCPSLTQSRDGQPIYVVFLGPFAVESDACTARAEGPEGAYARRLSSELTPDHVVDCP